MESYVHKGIFRTRWKINSGAFFTSVKSYFKNMFNSIALGSIFCTTHPFMKKLTTFVKKSFVKNRTIFSKLEIMQWNRVINKEGFLTLQEPFISQSCIEIKIELNFYFPTSLWCLKRFCEVL